ncbi:MAG: hypothetical protein PHH06_00980 [Candidatus Gracilibacteria bacterium]|nr:hypothetical protein [Candidatus Gracilibacteria bacterium]
MPDVGFFLKNLSDRGSLSKIKLINAGLRENVINSILDSDFPNVSIITRPNVVENNEDLLEINKIEVMKSELEKGGKVIKISSTKDFVFKEDILYLLMDIDYNDLSNLSNLFELAIKYPRNFSPNPFVQLASQYVIGFKSIYLYEGQDIQKLSRVVTPNHNKISQSTLENIENYFNSLGLDPNKRIINIKKGSTDEILYVSRDSLYSLRKIAKFIEGEKFVEIIEVPFVDGEQIISKNGNDLLHMYRFMFIN